MATVSVVVNDSTSTTTTAAAPGATASAPWTPHSNRTPNPVWFDHAGLAADGLPGPVTWCARNADDDAHVARSDRRSSGPRRCAPLESAPLESLPYGTPVGHRLVVVLEIVERRIVVVQIDDLPAPVGIRPSPTRP